MIEIRTGDALLTTTFDLERSKNPIRIMLWAFNPADKDRGGVGVFITLSRKQAEQVQKELDIYIQYMKEKDWK